jgi:thiol-disulfide isomerase/thioredoxin
MKKLLSLLSLIVLLLYSCTPAQKRAELKQGIWRATVQTSGGALPFGLEIVKISDTSLEAYAINGKEKLRLDNAQINGDSVKIPMEIFESEIVAKIEDSTLTGRFTKYGINKSTTVPFQAELGKNYRFMPDLKERHDKLFRETGAMVKMAGPADFSGKWSVTFFTEKDTTEAVGIFDKEKDNLSGYTGTFLTTTGDYRYLAGSAESDSLLLSCFDGSHLFLFKAKLTGDTLRGGFWSGKSGYENWVAVRNDKAALPDAGSLTFLKKGFDKIDFSFPDADGKLVSLKDERFKGKVVILQIMGSWCPNCMDETNFLSPWYKKNKDKGVEIAGLAFEKSPDLKISAPKLKKMIKRFDIQYPVVLAGVNNKEEASKALPMLNRIVGYPTTIFIDKKGVVRYIHTGFSGPGTGKYYDEWIEDFEKLVEKLKAES